MVPSTLLASVTHIRTYKATKIHTLRPLQTAKQSVFLRIQVRASNQTKGLAPVVQKLDSTIHRINHYPADTYYGKQLRYQLDSDLPAG